MPNFSSLIFNSSGNHWIKILSNPTPTPSCILLSFTILFGYLALTERQRQILRLHVEGLSDYRIAHELKIEMPTNIGQSFQCTKCKSLKMLIYYVLPITKVPLLNRLVG
jgi:hypothetical protein